MPPFQPFDPRGSLSKTWRNLPHWHQPGATYFVTFRLADALPVEARARLAEMRMLNEGEAFAWIERYLDAGTGSCMLAVSAHAAVIENALHHFDGMRYELGTFAIMPNHVHVLVQPLGAATLTHVVHGWKSYTANRLQRAGVIHGQVWQEESFDRITRNEDELRRFRDYILANPIAVRLAPGKFVVGKGTANWCST